MKQLSLLVLGCLFAISFTACKKDLNTATVTYQEATATYGNLEAVRNLPLNNSVRAVENPGKVFVGADFILLGEEEQGVHVINNSDINNPQFINFIDIPGNREFFVKGDFLYAESYYDLIKIDLTDLSNVQLVARANNILQETITNDNGEALLGFTFNEVTKDIDVKSDIYNEIVTEQFIYYDFAKQVIPKSAVPSSFAGNSNGKSGTVNRITHAQDHVYVISLNAMAIIDDANGVFQSVGSTSQINFPEAMETIFPYEDKLFVGSRTSMNIYDAANPETPFELYEFQHATSCDPVLPTDDVAYITLRTADFSDCPGNTNALVVLNIENLDNPREEEQINMASPYGMTVIGDRLFVGEGENGLSIFDVSDRKKPISIKKDDGVKAYDIIAHPSNENIVLIAGPNGLSQYTMDGDNSNIDLDFNSQIQY